MWVVLRIDEKKKTAYTVAKTEEYKEAVRKFEEHKKQAPGFLYSLVEIPKRVEIEL